MPWTNGFKNTMLDAGVTAVGGTIYASLHTGAPGSTGANEASGGSPAYARKVLPLGAAGAVTQGAKKMTSSIIFDVPAGTYDHVGFWDTLTSGDFLGWEPITPYSPVGQDTIAIASGDLNLNNIASA